MLSFGNKESSSSMLSADNIDEALCETCGMSRMQRYMTCTGLFVTGWIISWLAFINLTNPSTFAILYTFGNLMAIISSFFLSGPCNQIKNMVKPVRIIATCVYLTMMGLTLFVAFKGYSAGIVFLCAFIQFLAMIWYIITYIPYGQTLLKNCLCGSCKV